MEAIVSALGDDTATRPAPFGDPVVVPYISPSASTYSFYFDSNQTSLTVDNPAAFGGSIPITNARPLIVTFEKSEATPEPASLLGLAVVAGLGAAASKRKRNAI